jgi:hypothetical protein
MYFSSGRLKSFLAVLAADFFIGFKYVDGKYKIWPKFILIWLFLIKRFKLPRDSGTIKMDVLAKGGKALLLGNEAIVRGALEAGVSFAAAYPGTPSSEIADTFSAIAKKSGCILNIQSTKRFRSKSRLRLPFRASARSPA